MIKIAGGNHASAESIVRKTSLGFFKVPVPFVQVKTVPQYFRSRVTLHTAADYIKVGIPVSVGIKKQHSHVLILFIFVESENRHRDQNHLAGSRFRRVPKQLSGLARSAPKIKVRISIPVNISPGLTGPELGELNWKKRLPDKIVKPDFLVFESLQGLHFGKLRVFRFSRLHCWRFFRGSYRLGHRIFPVHVQIAKNLSLPTGPIDSHQVYFFQIPQTEMNHRVIPVEESTQWIVLSDLLSIRRFNGDLASDSIAIALRADEIDEDPIAAGTAVAVERGGVLQIGDQQLEVAVPVKVGIRRAITDPLVIHAPFLADIIKGEVALVLEHHVLLAALGRSFVMIPMGLPDQVFVFHFWKIRVVELPGNSVREKHITETIVVKISTADRPGPFRHRQPGKPCRLHKMISPGIDVDRVAHQLCRAAHVFEILQPGPHRSH